MTDTQAATPVEPAQPAQPLLTEEQQIDSIKTFLFQGIFKNFQDYSAAIQRLPLNENMKRIILEWADTSWVWVKEAFNVLEIKLPQAVEVKKEKQRATKKKAKKK
jgi:hypothetical protein